MLPVRSRLSWDLQLHSYCTAPVPAIIPRKPKWHTKLEIARAKVGRRRRTSTATFQKKLVVFKCMGKMAPKSFTRADKHICMRGLLQPINLDAFEEEVRKEICEVICSNPELADCNPSDFELIDMCGKQASTPNCTSTFVFDARAVKQDQAPYMSD